jgi:thymidylate synthase (FAD)
MEIKVLDHGYIKLIEHWGSDERIIEAARMSTNKGFLGWDERCKVCGCTWEAYANDFDGPLFRPCNGNPHEFVKGDEKLLSYLWKNGHHTPFEMAGMTVEVQAPIFVFREWHRHRTQSYNELSARYTPIPDQHYLPLVSRCMDVDPLNKQAGAVDGTRITADAAEEWQDELAALYEQSERVYQSGLRRGIPKEIARLSVCVGRYSRMRASANLRNWLQFGSLRTGRGVQLETKAFAEGAMSFISELFPRTYALWKG